VSADLAAIFHVMRPGKNRGEFTNRDTFPDPRRCGARVRLSHPLVKGIVYAKGGPEASRGRRSIRGPAKLAGLLSPAPRLDRFKPPTRGQRTRILTRIATRGRAQKTPGVTVATKVTQMTVGFGSRFAQKTSEIGEEAGDFAIEDGSPNKYGASASSRHKDEQYDFHPCPRRGPRSACSYASDFRGGPCSRGKNTVTRGTRWTAIGFRILTFRFPRATQPTLGRYGARLVICRGQGKEPRRGSRLGFGDGLSDDFPPEWADQRP